MRGMTKGALALGVAMAAIATPTSAHHSWGGYHWARTANPVTVKLADNVDSRWDTYLREAQADWNKSTVIESPIAAGSSSPATCAFVAGTIQVCNSTYGATGWLGIASINITSGNHITSGTVKLNDTYFNTAQYNTAAWRRLVMCQEVAHDYGLDHQNEAFNNPNLGTCMDYTNDPDGGGRYGPSNEHPNAHDYDQLVSIYSHLDSTTTIAFGSKGAGAARAPGNTPKEWGRAVHVDEMGRPDVFQRVEDSGTTTVTHVFWALGQGPRVR